MGAPNHDPGAEKGPGGDVSKNPWPTGMVTAYAWSLEKELYQASPKLQQQNSQEVNTNINYVN